MARPKRKEPECSTTFPTTVVEPTTPTATRTFSMSRDYVSRTPSSRPDAGVRSEPIRFDIFKPELNGMPTKQTYGEVLTPYALRDEFLAIYDKHRLRGDLDLRDLWKSATKHKAKHYRIRLHSPKWTNMFIDDICEQLTGCEEFKRVTDQQFNPGTLDRLRADIVPADDQKTQFVLTGAYLYPISEKLNDIVSSDMLVKQEAVHGTRIDGYPLEAHEVDKVVELLATFGWKPTVYDVLAD